MRERISLCDRADELGRLSLCGSTAEPPGRRGAGRPDEARRPRGVRGALIAVALGLASCGGESGGARAFDAVRVQAPSGPELESGASSAKRFGFAVPAAERARSHGGGSGTGEGGAASGLAWDVPSGWSELAPTSMRVANFAVDGAECYLTLLGGDGGGLAANVNRWRGQVGLAPLDGAALEALPREPFFGGEATRVDLVGTFAGMGGERADTGYRIVGLLRVSAAGSAFLKFVGPTAVVERELAAFAALAASFRPDAPASAEAPSAQAPSMTSAGPAGPELASGPASPRYAWVRPEGWAEGPPRMMREVTFLVGDVECYLAELPGDAGGVRANFDRWRGQLGGPPLTELEFEALDSLPMLGATARLIEIEGDFTGMAGATVPRARLLGAVCFLGDRTVFVKLVGPAAQADRERQHFLDLCRSLERLP